MASSLPDASSRDISLVVATSAENLAQTNANSLEWRGALSLPAYLKREELLLQQDLTKDYGLTAWMLVYQAPGSDERKVLCGCESIKKRALLKTVGGELKEVAAHGVASVFCEPKHRGKGYAARMMEDLGKRLDGWQGESHFSVLWSNIGKQFYAARGWKAFPSLHVDIPDSSSAQSLILPETSALHAADLAELCHSDETLLRKRLAALASSKTTVALVPDVRTIDWHHAREDFIGNELISRSPKVKGAIVNTGSPGKRAWCVWTRVWKNPNEEAGHTLHILRLVVEDESYTDFVAAGPANTPAKSQMNETVVKQIAALFTAAQREAQNWDMSHVQLWNPTSTALEAARRLAPGVEIVAREKESICSLRWYGEGNGDEVEWVCNEKFGWC